MVTLVSQKIKEPRVEEKGSTAEEAEVHIEDPTNNNVTPEESIEACLEDDISKPESRSEQAQTEVVHFGAFNGSTHVDTDFQVIELFVTYKDSYL